jgi:AAA domain
MSTTTLPEQLVSLGFSPELAAVITPDEFREETERAWKTVLQELKGEQPDPATAATLQLKVLAPPPPSPIESGEVRGEGCLSSSGSDSASSASPSPANDDDLYPCYAGRAINTGRFEDRYLIPGILTAGEPGGLFGSFKTLKTSLTADLLISLASGTPFLGHFEVPEPGRTLFMSGESGLAALQSLARRISASRGIDLDTLDTFELCPRLPHLDRPDDIKALGRLIRRKRPVCLAIDPAYLAIRGGDARNVFSMGDLLQPLGDLGAETGCTILIVHHCKRSKVHPGDPATLDDIAWTGFSEFAGQWLLVARRRRYDPETGHHELWFSTGGRAGHCGLWALDVDEGLATNPGGRVWKPSIRQASSAQAQSDTRTIEAGESRRAQRAALVFARDRRRALTVVLQADRPVNARYLRFALGLNGTRINQLLASLIHEGVLKRSERACGLRTEVEYTLSDRCQSALASTLAPDEPEAQPGD